MMKTLWRLRTGMMPRPAMITSRTLSTPVCVAASISRTSMSRPSAISTQASQTPHGSAVGPFSQFSARARMRAVVVLPTPRGPANTNACASRPLDERVLQRSRHRLLADDIVEPLRAPLAGDDLVRHSRISVVQISECTKTRNPKSRRILKGFRAFVPSWPDVLCGLNRGPEGPAAHVRIYLALLPSGPDAVRRLKLHRFRTAVQSANVNFTTRALASRGAGSLRQHLADDDGEEST